MRSPRTWARSQVLPGAQPGLRQPGRVRPLVTFTGYGILILGGLANYYGVAVGSLIFWTLFEGLRFIELPIEQQVAALRFIIVGVVLILLMAFRPPGMFGKKEEMVLGE